MATEKALLTKTGGTLAKKLALAERRKKLEAVGLVTPLLLLMIVFYFVPIILMLHRAVDNSQMRESMPNAAAALQSWNGKDLPNARIFTIVANDLKQARKNRTIAKVGRRLNFDKSGFYSLLSRSGRKLSKLKNCTPTCSPNSGKEILLKIDKRWGERSYWIVLKRGLQDSSMVYLLSALDLRYNDNNEIVSVPEKEAVYIAVITRTIYISAAVTILCLLLGFPVAYFLATAQPRVRNMFMIILLLVFWTSLLVRTLSWILVLQNHGVVNSALMGLGITGQPLDLIFNRFAVYIAMTHVLLPFMVLPLYAVMRGIPTTYVRAAHSLGATPFTAFWTVYLPQTRAGIGAGGLMVFIQALGYYITPALVGGPKDQMVSYFVAFFVNERVNWSMASALGLVLLVLTGTLYLIFGRKVNIANMKMG